jgi:hypothetical protein
LSSARVPSSSASAQMRTIGVTPVGSAARQICVASCAEIAPCSMSMNSQSWSVAAASMPVALVRRWCTPKPSASWLFCSFCLVLFSNIQSSRMALFGAQEGGGQAQRRIADLHVLHGIEAR